MLTAKQTLDSCMLHQNNSVAYKAGVNKRGCPSMRAKGGSASIQQGNPAAHTLTLLLHI